MKTKLLVGLVCAVATTSSLAVNQSPIKIATNNWTSQIVLSHVLGQILTNSGHKVEYVSSATKSQWFRLGSGGLHVQTEVWQGTMADKFNGMVKEGKIIDAGAHDANTREEWWYPEYVEQLCPGLPDWKALLKCSKVFSSDGTDKGLYVTGPWGKPDQTRIRALGLNFRVKKVKSGDALWEELKKANETKKPILMFNWTPNWVEAIYKGKFVEFPDWTQECVSKPEWGLSKDYLYDCGNPKKGWLKKAVWSGMPEKWPCAFDIVKNMNFDNANIAKLAAWVDVEKMTAEKAASKWIKENKDKWQGWKTANCKS